jgi:phosphoglycolate phosphatase
MLFDLDGTLLDTAPDLVRALVLLCEEKNVTPPDFDFAARHVSTGAIGLTSLAFPDYPDDEQTALSKQLVDIYTENLCELTRPYPGIESVLDHLDERGMPWGVVTNKIERLTLPILDTLGLKDRCAVIVGGDTTPNNKPHPDPIICAAGRINIAPEAVAYVGDHRKDVDAAHAAGSLTVAVTWGYIIPGEDPYDWGADYTIERPEELLSI